MASKFMNLFLKNYLNLFDFFEVAITCFYKYNQIDKHLRNRMMEWIIFGECRFSQLLCFEETFNEEKGVYEKTKVGG